MPDGNGFRAQRKFDPIAIIGMRGRFPGANDLDQYWSNLAKGVESITQLGPEDVRAAGIPDEVAQLPGYVHASPVLDDVDQFDAEFFGFSARDAALTDPQHRLFLETTWEALEDAGYDPSTYEGAIGLFGGCEQSTYLYQLYLNRDALGYLDGMQLMVTNDKDHLCMQASYRLDLRGPSVVVQTTCSTSLVAVSLACESLQADRCDMALAGGVTVRVPQYGGYLYTPGSILSPDGHCRPFDAEAEGTIVGSGVGLVVLKRLERALADGDNIRAVIRGVGLNNDGSDKAGYTAPSFRGQAGAIRAAQGMAGVAVETIGYIEAHGTGTILGDPIELSALIDVFREHTDRRGFCGIGSVKSNFGHLSCAAGVAGLIKTVLMFEHKAIPPTVHYRVPNPAIDFVSSPFYVSTDLQPWPRNGAPRRAGISSFGVGGTNAHVILEEAPERVEQAKQRNHQLLVFSARSPASLDTACRRLAMHLQAHPEISLPDAAFTLHTGRRAFRHRRTLVVRSDDRAFAIAALREPETLETSLAGGPRPVVFMFPGQGSQYPGMAEALYRSEPVVRDAIDHCAKALKSHVGRDIRTLLFPPERERKQAATELMNTAWAQPALFTVEYAVAALWRSWGIEPAAMVGHSVGEYVAATIAGVMTLDDALLLIARRGQLIAAMPRGAMIAVMADHARLAEFIHDEVSLAAVNAPGLCVLSGPHHAIERLETTLAECSIAARRLHTSHAFHSAMMDPMLADFREVVASVSLSAPQRPFVSTLTGRWADGAVATPGYWSDQLRNAVRFADALAALADEKGPVGKQPYFLEVGPGRALTTFTGQTLKGGATLGSATLPGPDDPRADTEVMLAALGRMWANGISVDWEGFHRNESRKRVALPTYAFDRRSYWIGAPPRSHASHQPREVADWFYSAHWRPAPPLPGPASLAAQRILVFDDETGVGATLAARLKELSAQPIVVTRGGAYERNDETSYSIDASRPEDFATLVAAVTASEPRLAGVLFCWGLSARDGDLKHAGELALLAPMRLAHALSSAQTLRPLPMVVVARRTAKVDIDDVIEPLRALGIGAARVIPQEHPGLRLAHIDIDTDAAIANQVLAELAAGAIEPAIALREGRRFLEAYEPAPLPRTETALDLPDRPVVLVTGGLGHIGINLSERLFEKAGARLVLIGRSGLPPAAEWAAAAADQKTPFAQRALLRRLARMQGERDDVLVVRADLNDGAQVKAVVDAAIARFGRIDVVLHGAGRIDPAAFASVAETGPSVIEAQMAPKLTGLLHLMAALRGHEPRRFILHSSISTVLGGLGLAAYAGINAALDAFALAGGEGWLSIDWDAWDNAAESRMEQMATPIHPVEGQEAFLRLLSADAGPRALVVVDDLDKRLQAWVHGADSVGKKEGGDRHPRPNLATPYEEPGTETERMLAEIWSEHLGVTPVGIFDRFLDLGGHSLLGVQVASEIRDRFQIEVPVIKLFQAPTISQLGAFIDKALSGEMAQAAPQADAPARAETPSSATATTAAGDNPADSAKASYRTFYDDISRRLKESGTGDASFFLNYGYVGDDGEAAFRVPEGVFNPNSIRLVYELIGSTDLRHRKVLDVGCGRGGTVALLAERFEAEPFGVDLSPEAIAFCRQAHRDPRVAFEVGDAENLPVGDQAFDAVTNIESSHTYPNLRAFFAQVKRVLRPGGVFLYTDLLPVQRWAEVRMLLASLRLAVGDDRDITDNVLASCDSVSAARASAFGGRDNMIDNFLAVPGSSVYVQMQSRAWEYRILRAHYT